MITVTPQEAQDVELYNDVLYSNQLPQFRWRCMKRKPRGIGRLFLKGTDGKIYEAHYEGGIVFSGAPGWVSFTGWRRQLPKELKSQLAE